MLSMGIIWNSANHLKKDILDDINQRVTLLDLYEFDLGESYIEFVRAIYLNEQMEQWKIDNKINHMLTSPSRKIIIIFFEFDSEKIQFHPFKKKDVFTQLEDCKTYIRNKYKNCVENYTFDIVFHATDNLVELKTCFNVITMFLKEKGLIKEVEEKKLLRIRNHPNIN